MRLNLSPGRLGQAAASTSLCLRSVRFFVIIATITCLASFSFFPSPSDCLYSEKAVKSEGGLARRELLRGPVDVSARKDEKSAF